MKKYLQTAAYILLTVVFITTIPLLWLGLFPEISILKYLSRWQAIGTFLSIFAIYAGLMAYIFGWDPKSNLLSWIRNKIILPILTNTKSLICLLLLLLVLEAYSILFISNFDNPYYEEVTENIFSGNYEGADRILGSLNSDPDRISELFIINDSARQAFYFTTQSVDKNLCRIYVNYFRKKRIIFRSAYERYLLKYGHALCLLALENHKESIKLFTEASMLSRWLSDDIERLTLRKIATVYFYDKHGNSDIEDKNKRLRHIINLIGSDSNLTAQRMVGSSYYLLGEYAKAAETWGKALESTSDEDVIEKKRMYNNIALAYTRINQNTLALDTFDKGLMLQFDESNEKERREQIRLLSNKSIALLKTDDCDGAEDTWETRNHLRQQELSKCTSILSAQIAACDGDRDKKPEILRHLLLGIGQDPESFKDFNPDALDSLVDQAKKVFEECYLGLEFNDAGVRELIR